MDDREISRLLFVNDPPAAAEVAIVFGAADEGELVARTRHAIKLYRQGYARRLLLTGGGTGGPCPEARSMERLVRDAGVRTSDVIVEDESIDTMENVRFSVAVLDRMGLLSKIDSLLLVSSAWHMGRVRHTTWRYLNELRQIVAPLTLLCCPPTNGCTAATWATDLSYRSRVLHEVALYRILQARGLL